MRDLYRLPLVEQAEIAEIEQRVERKAFRTGTAQHRPRQLLKSRSSSAIHHNRKRLKTRAHTAKHNVRTGFQTRSVTTRQKGISAPRSRGPDSTVPGSRTRKRPRTTLNNNLLCQHCPVSQPIPNSNQLEAYRQNLLHSRQAFKSPYSNKTDLRLLSRDIWSQGRHRQHASTAPSSQIKNSNLTDTVRPLSVFKKYNITIRPKTALGMLPLPPLDETYGATRGWLYRKGDLAVDSYKDSQEEIDNLNPALKWNKRYFVADPESQTLVQFGLPDDEISTEVIVLKNAKIRATKKSKDKNLYCFVINTEKKYRDKTGNILLGCSEERIALKWMKVLRGIVHGKNYALKNKYINTHEETHQTEIVADYPQKNANNILSLDMVTTFEGTPIEAELQKIDIVLVKGGTHHSLPVVDNEAVISSTVPETSIMPWRVVTKANRAAEIIQKTYRGFLAKMLLSRMKVDTNSSTVIQSLLRGHMARKLAAVKKEKYDSVLIIQSAWRSYCSKLILFRKKYIYKSAAKVQASWRMFLACGRAKLLRKERSTSIDEFRNEILDLTIKTYNNVMSELLHQLQVRSITKLQSWWRKIAAVRVFVAHKQLTAATIIQKFLIQCNKRKFARSWRQMQWRRRHAATTINSKFWLMILAKRHLKELRCYFIAAVKIQSAYRCFICFKKWRSIQRAAATVNRFSRFVIALQVVVLMKRIRWIRNDKCIKIQGWVRGTKARVCYYQLLNQRDAASTIQAFSRGKLVRRLYKQHRLYACIIQRYVRVFQAKLLLQRLRMNHLNEAAGKIQRTFRSWYKWRALLIFRRRLSYRFSSPGFLCRLIVRYKKFHVAALASLIGNNGNFSIRLCNLISGKTKHKIFCGWYIARLIRNYSKQILTAPDIARILIVRMIANEEEEDKSEPISLPRQFDIISRTLVQRQLLSRTFTISPQFKSASYLKPLQEIPSSFIPERVNECKSILSNYNEEFQDYEVSFAQVLIELSSPVPAIFYLKNGKESIHSYIASKFSSNIISQGMKMVLRKKMNYVGTEISVESGFGFDIKELEEELLHYIKEIEEAKELENSILKTLEETAFLNVDLKDTVDVCRLTQVNREDLLVDLKRWTFSKEQIEMELKTKGCRDDDPRALLTIAEIDNLNRKIAEATKVCNQQDTLIAACKAQELKLIEMNTALHRVRSEFMYLTHRSRKLRKGGIREKLKSLSKIKPLIQRMNKQYGTLLGAVALRDTDLMKQCENEILKMNQKLLLFSLTVPFQNRPAEQDLKLHLYLVLSNVDASIKAFLNHSKIILNKNMRIREKAQASLELLHKDALRSIQEADENMKITQECYTEDIELIKTAANEQVSMEANKLFAESHDSVSRDRSDREVVFEFKIRIKALLRALKEGIEQVEEAISMATVATRASFEARQMYHVNDRVKKLEKALESDRLETAAGHADKLYERLVTVKELDDSSQIELPSDFFNNILDTVDYIMDDIDDFVEAEERIDGMYEIKSDRDPTNQEIVEDHEETKFDKPEKPKPTSFRLAAKLAFLSTIAHGKSKVVSEKKKVSSSVNSKAIKTIALLRDPRGKKKERMQRAAVKLQKVYRGMQSRRMVKHKAALCIQKAWRRKTSYDEYVRVLFASTEKHYDSASGHYYYVWANQISWKPPKALKGMHIRYGRRIRPKNYVWTETEAAILIQGTYRANKTRKAFIQLIKESYEKVYEPTKDAFFYQNLRTKKCQWNRPFGLKPEEEVDRVFLPPNSKAAIEAAFWNTN